MKDKRSRLPTPQLDVEDINKSRSTVKIYADKGSVSQTTRRLKPYKSLPEKVRPALEKVGEYVRVQMIPRVFEEEGPGWKPLARRTVVERELQGYGGEHPILVRTRDLFEELTQKSHPKHIETVKVGKHARIEIGGSSVKFIENQMGKRAQNLPKRPMIPGTGNIQVPMRDRVMIKQILEKELKKRFR